MKKEAGFSALEVTLIVVILGFIVGTFWFVKNNDKKQDRDIASSKQSAQKENETAEDEATTKSSESTKTTVDPYANWKTYKNENLFVGFDYPSDWRVEAKDTSQSDVHYINAYSPDFVADDASSSIPNPKKGAVFSVYISKNQFNWKTLTEAIKGVPGFANPTSIKIDNLDAATGSENYSSIATRVLRSLDYIDLTYLFVQGQKDTNYNQYQHWLSTVKLREESFPVGN